MIYWFDDLSIYRCVLGLTSGYDIFPFLTSPIFFNYPLSIIHYQLIRSAAQRNIRADDPW